MNCKETNIDSSFWNFVKRFPALRYMKAPVFDVSQLYERYKDGLEWGVYAFVIKKFCFYGWDFKNKEWKKIGFTSEDLIWDSLQKRDSNFRVTCNDFSFDMQDENNRKRLLYDNLKKDGWADVGNFNFFNSKLGFGKQFSYSKEEFYNFLISDFKK